MERFPPMDASEVQIVWDFSKQSFHPQKRHLSSQTKCSEIGTESSLAFAALEHGVHEPDA